MFRKNWQEMLLFLKAKKMRDLQKEKETDAVV
jgi:hypothetical protein